MATLAVSTLLPALVYASCKAIYNVFFHPLANCPGPFLARISSILSFYHAVKGDRHIWVWQCFQIYGQTFRATPDTVLFCTPRATHDIYGSHSHFRKSSFYDAWPRHKDDYHTLNTTDPKLHAKKKKLLKFALSKTSMREVSRVMAEHIDRWLEIMLDSRELNEWSAPRDMAELADWLALDIIGDLVFGKSFNAKEPTPENNPFKKIPDHVVKFMRIAYPVGHSPFLRLIIWLKPRGLNYLLSLMIPKEVEEYNIFIAESVADSIAMGKYKPFSRSHRSILHVLSAMKDPVTQKPSLSTEELLAEAHLLNIAGRDTVAVTISALFFYLCHYPRVYEKVANEIRTKFSTPQDIFPGHILSSCHYLKACINEALRMAPAGTSEHPREILHPGATIDGKYYPEGIVVGVGAWAVAYNEAVYGDPGIYRPERWLICEETGPSAEEVRRLKAGFHPFSQGPGACPGQEIAMIQLMMLIGRTIHMSDVRLTPGSTLGEGGPSLSWGRRFPNQYQLEDMYMAVRKGPSVQFKRRVV